MVVQDWTLLIFLMIKRVGCWGGGGGGGGVGGGWGVGAGVGGWVRAWGDTKRSRLPSTKSSPQIQE